MGEVLALSSNNLSGVETILPADLLDGQTNGHRLAYLAGIGQIDRQMIPIIHLPAILSDSEHQQLLSALTRQETSEVETP
jgi:hypothetical protein